MKLWQKDSGPDAQVERFTVGKDREMDVYLAAYDVMGSLAHTRMLESIGLLTAAELEEIQRGLKDLYRQVVAGNFRIEEGIEDVHSQVEHILTQQLGDAGKKIHSGRSRNDQVLVDLKLFLRAELRQTAENVKALFDSLQRLSQQHASILLPGYTHLQIAMPSSFGLWLGAYAESLSDDMLMIQAAYRTANQNPLGSAAGYGSTFPLNRTMTTQLLGFESLNYNVVYAQMGRGKTERAAAMAIGSVAATLSRLAMDICLYMNQNFGFITFPDALTTGSSIMPHKKNPDIFELTRARCNRLTGLANEINLMTNNLPSGYHRDMQLIKEHVFPAFQDLNDCINILLLALPQMQVKQNILDDAKYQYLFSVDAVNQLVLQGMPFRDAYKQIGLEIEAGTFSKPEDMPYTHEGSIGNLCHAEINAKMHQLYTEFQFDKVDAALASLLDH
jgi:argininosuccinate lyase